MPSICFKPDCNKDASFNFSNETKRLYCKEHKLDNMIDLKNKKCNKPYCNKK